MLEVHTSTQKVCNEDNDCLVKITMEGKTFYDFITSVLRIVLISQSLNLHNYMQRIWQRSYNTAMLDLANVPALSCRCS